MQRLVILGLLVCVLVVAVGVVVAGEAWTPPESLGLSAYSLDMTAAGDTVYLGWYYNSKDDKSAYYRAYDLATSSWGSPLLLGTKVTSLEMASSGQACGAAYDDEGKIIYAELAGTAVITTDLSVPLTPPNDFQVSPALDMGPQPHVAWTARIGDDFSVYYTHRHDGATWSTPTVVYSDAMINVGVSMAVSYPRVFLGWEHHVDTLRTDLFLVEGSLNGQGEVISWTVPITINAGVPVTMPFSQRLDLAVADGRLHAVWVSTLESGVGEYDSQYIFTASRSLAGGSWSAPVLVDVVQIHNLVTTYPHPRLVTGSGLQLVWHGRHRGVNGSGEDVYRAESLDGGATWSSPQDLSGSPDDMSILPAGACPGQVCYVAWREQETIYWRKTLPPSVYLPVVLKSYR